MRTLKGLSVVVIALALGTLSGVTLSAQGDAAAGTWKLNVAKSKYSGTAPKSATLKIENSGQGVKISTEGVAADGTKTATSYTASYDGKESPLTGSATADTVSLKRIDANTVERTDKKAGKVVNTIRRTLSADGKTLTITSKGTNAQGQPTSSTAIYERQ